MIRPCDQCGGQGMVASTDPLHLLPQPCSRCEGMPWLPCPHFRTCIPFTKALDYSCGGRFRPDPDSVIRWCFEHRSAAADGDENCEGSVIDALLGATCIEVCEIGWVARPERLEVAE
jgi:hypothetical protein